MARRWNLAKYIRRWNLAKYITQRIARRKPAASVQFDEPNAQNFFCLDFSESTFDREIKIMGSF